MSPARPSGDEERKKLAGRASIVGAGTLVSRILGLVRDQTIAAVFTRAETDAFWVAFTLPNLLRSLLGEGAASSAVVPWLVELFAAGMHARPGAFERTVMLTRWLFPYIFFMGTAALGMAALNSYGR